MYEEGKILSLGKLQIMHESSSYSVPTCHEQKSSPFSSSVSYSSHTLLLGSLCTTHQLQGTAEGLGESRIIKQKIVPQEKASHNGAVQL